MLPKNSKFPWNSFNFTFLRKQCLGLGALWLLCTKCAFQHCVPSGAYIQFLWHEATRGTSTLPLIGMLQLAQHRITTSINLPVERCIIIDYNFIRKFPIIIIIIVCLLFCRHHISLLFGLFPRNFTCPVRHTNVALMAYPC